MKTPTGKGETDHHALTKGRKSGLSKITARFYQRAVHL
jgi:hypothetical protein